jgi:hypothetical protein
MIMRHSQKVQRIMFLALLLIAACITTARAQAGGPYEITKPTIAAGSSTSAGGNYVIIGTMGQHDAAVMGGGPYQFDGGFWPEELGFAPPPCATDVTAQLKIKENELKIKDGGFTVEAKTGRVVQTVKITNVSLNNIRGPLSFVLDALSSDVMLDNRSGITFCALPASPYVVVDLGIDGVLAPREQVTIRLEFTTGDRRKIKYRARVLAGISR